MSKPPKQKQGEQAIAKRYSMDSALTLAVQLDKAAAITRTSLLPEEVQFWKENFSHYPPEMIEAAFREHLLTSEFFPKPANIKALIDNGMVQRYKDDAGIVEGKAVREMDEYKARVRAEMDADPAGYDEARAAFVRKVREIGGLCGVPAAVVRAAMVEGEQSTQEGAAVAQEAHQASARGIQQLRQMSPEARNAEIVDEEQA